MALKRSPLRKKPGSSTLSRKPKKKRTKRQTGGNKTKVWSLKKADERMSLYIRMRDGKCMFPECSVRALEKLQCSHYIGRSKRSTRFDPNNLIALCWLHHFKDKMLGYEYQKQRVEKHGWDGQYTLFMKNLLGENAWNALLEKEKVSVSQRNAIRECMDFLEPHGPSGF